MRLPGRVKRSEQKIRTAGSSLTCLPGTNLFKTYFFYSLVRWLSLRSFSSAAERRKIRDMNFRVEIEQEEDGRWIAEVVDLPGVLAYGSTSKEAQAKVQALALRVVADRLEHGEAGPDLVSISFAAA